MYEKDEKQLYESLDAVAGDLAHPELVMPDLIWVMRVVEHNCYDPELRATVRRWRQDHGD